MPRPVSKKNWSPHKRGRIRKMYDLSVPIRKIALDEGIPRGTVHGLVTRYDHQVKGRDRPRPGRPKKLSERQERYIIRLIEENPFIKNQEIINQADLSISEWTLTQYLQSKGIQHRRALKRPKLTPANAAIRLRFAQEHVDKPLSWWRQVIFSDECSIVCGDGEKEKWCWCTSVRFCCTSAEP